MNASERQMRSEKARDEVHRLTGVVAAIETERRSVSARLAELDRAASMTRDKLLEDENGRRRLRQLDGDWKAQRDALDQARANLLFAQRRIGGVVSIRGMPDAGLGPSQKTYLRAEDAADPATMFLEPHGVRATVRAGEVLIPYAMISEITTEEGTHDAAWCATQAQAPTEEVAPHAVLDAHLAERFKFGLDRPEERLSLLRGSTIKLGARGLEVTYKAGGHVVPYKQVLVAELEPAKPPAHARLVDLAWFRHPTGKVTVSTADRLLPRRDPVGPTAPVFAGLPFAASGVRKFLDVARDRGLAMWLGGPGLHVNLDGRSWLVPYAAVRFARLQTTGAMQ